MRRLPLPVLTLLALACLPRASAAPEPPVEVELAWVAQALGDAESRPIAFEAAPPGGVTMPKEMKAPHFARIALPDGRGLALVFDADPTHPKLWIDEDFDGDLAEETSPLLTRDGSSWSRRQFLTMTLPGETSPLPLPVAFVHTPALGAAHLTWSAAAHRRGRVVLGGRVRTVLIADGNRDLRFDGDEADPVYLDLDGDGTAHIVGDAERIRPDIPFRVASEAWEVAAPDLSGRRLAFRRATKAPAASLRAWCDRPVPPSGVVRHPPIDSYATLLTHFERERLEAFDNRVETIRLLGGVGTAESFAFLTELASTDTDARVAAEALRAMGNAAYVTSGGGARVAEMARKASGAPAEVLARVLHEMGHPEREAVYLDMLRGVRRGAQAAAAPWLAYLGTGAARDALLDLARNKENAAARTTAYVRGLRSLRGGPPLERMLAAAGDEHLPLKAEAILDLARLGHPSARTRTAALAREDRLPAGVQQTLARALGALGGPKAVRALLAMLETERLHGSVPGVIAAELAALRGPKVRALLLKALKSRAPRVRATVVRALTGWVEPEITEALLARARKEKEETVLLPLLGALGRHGDEEAIALLVQLADPRSPGAVGRAAVDALTGFGLTHPQVRPLLLRLLDAPRIEQRLTALSYARRLDDPQVLARVLANLQHDNWTVRLAALEAVDAQRPRSAVGALIARLAAEPVQRVRDAIPPVLFRITGMNLYDDPATWRQWYGKEKDTFRVPEEIPQLPPEPEGGTVATFYGIPVKTNRVVFVLDRSGSMEAESDPRHWKDGEVPNRYEIAVRETLGALERLDATAEVDVVLFNATIHPWRGKLQRLGKTTRSAIRQYLRTTKPIGGTNVYDALEMALRMPEVDTVFLLSDGEPRSGKHVGAGAILGAVRRENARRRIAIHCVSIGTDSGLLRRLAQENDGTYVRR